MESVVVPPPLPPKTRKPSAACAAPPASATVYVNPSPISALAVFPEVQGPQSATHIVKIRIDPPAKSPVIRINVGAVEVEDMVQCNKPAAADCKEPYFFYGPFPCSGAGMVMSSGQCSPSDTLDSGTCSDLEAAPPLPAKASVTVVSSQHKRAASLTSSGAEADSDDNESNISSDSLNGSEPQTVIPRGLLQDIRDRSTKLCRVAKDYFEECTYEERQDGKRQAEESRPQLYDADKYYKFHLNERFVEGERDRLDGPKPPPEDETFAGYKDILRCDGSSTIRSAKGTVRGVKNRVRAGIATFLQINSTAKTFKEKDAGKVVVYTTTMGIVRETYQRCIKVKKILRTLLIKFEERDLFMSSELQTELRERLPSDCSERLLVPQLFVDGQHIGDAETVERLNESGELRRILKPYKSADACSTCQMCGGYRLLPCPVCNGSKKSVHRNHFTAEFVALKCMNCDEVGLIRCTNC